MNFDRIFREIIGLLVLEERVSYRRLMREFGLDAEYLDNLCFELTEVRRLTIDEDGRFLVWAPELWALGEQQEQQLWQLRSVAPSSPESVMRVRVPPGSSAASAGAITGPLEPSLPAGEHRHLTVMFCDLASSTELSTRLDPEDLQDVIRGYQETVAKIFNAFDGFIAKCLGDGVGPSIDRVHSAKGDLSCTKGKLLGRRHWF